MSEGAQKVVDLAFSRAEKRKKKSGGGEPPAPPSPPDPPSGWDGPPARLPPDSPVKALGRSGRTFYFLNVTGEFIPLQAKEVGRLEIISLFGDETYLMENWPRYDKSGKLVINFDHGAMASVLIGSCTDRGIWTPDDNVRGVGTWPEDEGRSLVMHCGDELYISDDRRGFTTDETGLRNRMLYPAAPPQPHPEHGRAGAGGPADVLYGKLKTWNWRRGDVDAKLHLGWIGAAMLGGAPDWRPIEWISGQSGSGKSTLMKLTRWVFGPGGMITSEDATPAGIKHKTKNTTLPISIDELESDGNNDRARDIVKLARIASSGGDSLRGSPSGDAMAFKARNVFQFSSIAITALPQQDRNRMAVLELDAVEWEGNSRRKREPGEDDDELDVEIDPVLGKQAEWAKIGRQLRGRLLSQWSRYKRTFNAYRFALEAQGHNARGCDQFGSLGAGYDLLAFDGIEDLAARAAKWAELLPAASLPETSGYSPTHRACLDELKGKLLDVWRGGTKESIASLLRNARQERLNATANQHSSVQVLEQAGIKIYRDKRDETGQAWLVAISHTHPGLATLFRGTPWAGLPGAPGAWAQMMDRLAGAITKNATGGRLKLRFDGSPQYCTALPWETVFQTDETDGEAELVNDKDRSE